MLKTRTSCRPLYAVRWFGSVCSLYLRGHPLPSPPLHSCILYPYIHIVHRESASLNFVSCDLKQLYTVRLSLIQRRLNDRAPGRSPWRQSSWLVGLHPELCTSHDCRVSSRVASHQSRIRVFASHCQSFSSHVSSHYSAVGRVIVTKSVSLLKILK